MDQVFIIRNFISDEDVAYLNNNISVFPDFVPRENAVAGLGGPDSNSWGITDEVRSKIIDIIKKVQDKFYESFEIEEDSLRFTNAMYVVMSKDGRVPLHTDDSGDYNGTGLETGKCFNGLLYLSDDYEGGQIIFPEQDINEIPKAGTLIYYLANGQTPHEVKKVLYGERKNMVISFEVNPNINSVLLK